jgi:hypothetical protein
MVHRPNRRLTIPLAILLLSTSGCSERLSTSSDGAGARAGPSILYATGARADGYGLTWFYPEASGAVRRLPEMNILERAAGPDVYASYYRTTDLNREFKRGFAEFTVPRFTEMSSARIVLRDGGVSSAYRFELSSYTDVDGVVDTSDYERPVSPLGAFEADANVEFDVSSLVTLSEGSGLGFRVKLEVDPTYAEMGSLGTGFAVRIEVTTTPAEATEFLQTVIRTLGLPPGVEGQLLAPLRGIAAILRDGNPANDDVACGKIQEFLDEVTAKAQSRELNPPQADDLLMRGRNIMTCHDGHADVRVFRDFPSFAAATAGLAEIDFEDQPTDGNSRCPSPGLLCTLIPNPLVLERVSFGNPFRLLTGFCSSCSPDPDNPDGGNIVLFLYEGSTIAFPANTDAAMLVVEGIGDAAFEIKVTDAAGDTTLVDGAGVLFGAVYLGVVSPNGISRIDIMSAGNGPLVVSSLYFGIEQKRTFQRHPASVSRS